MNCRATGDPEMDWITHSAGLLAKFARPVKALSLGCGFGVIERVLRRCDYCQLIHGLDVAEGAIEGAMKAAQNEGLDGLTYEVADLNTATLPREMYDVVYLHAALHHVFQLEHLLDQIRQTLKPGGLFVCMSISGRRRCSFHDAISNWLTLFLARFRSATGACKGQRALKSKLSDCHFDAMNSSDPSESIRASEIVPLIANRFEVRHFRYVGGTLLLLIFSEIAGNFQEDAETMPLVKALIALDNFLIDNKVLPSYHVYMVCEKTENPRPMQAHNILPPSASVFPTDNLQAFTIKSPPTGLITAEPNPFQPDSQGVGQTTISWLVHGTSKVEVHVDAPDGPLFMKHGPGRYAKLTGRWIRDALNSTYKMCHGACH
jgi:ubiquinone/menaquinone biosynthesis C-methylase UbiE